jgi:phage gp36-like protein
VELAIYHLYSRRSVVPPVRQRNYEEAVAFLKQVAAGQIMIVGLQGELPTVTKEVTDFTSAIRVFSRDTLADW